MRDLDAWLDEVIVGARTGPVVVTLVPYDPAWPAVFAAHRDRLAGALGDVARRIEHIGSTAVPGLAAKPIVDVLVAVPDPDDDAAFSAALTGAGYVLRVREPGHRMFRTPGGDVQVHLWRDGSDDVDRHLRFRDRLRAEPADRERYAQVKRALAAREWPDVNHYAQAKSAVIAEILIGVRLRPGTAGDRDRLVAWLTDERAAASLSPMAVDALDEALGAGRALVVEAAGVAAGVVCWTPRSTRSRIAGLHTVAIDPDRAGAGLGRAAVQAAVRLLVDEHGFHRVEAETYGFNAAARRVFLAAGFAEEGVRRRAYDRHGGWQDGVLFGLVAD